MTSKHIVTKGKNQYEIPDEFIIEIEQGKDRVPFIKYAGLLNLANQMGTPILQTKNVSTRPEEIIYESTGYLIPNAETLEAMGITDRTDPRFEFMVKTPSVAHGTCNAKNLNERMQKYAEVMAETRANVRVLRILTGCNLAAVEEMDKADLKGNFETTSAADLYAKENLGNAKTREEMIKELMVVQNEVPYSAIIQRGMTNCKTTTYTGMSTEAIKDTYDKVVKVLNSKR